MTQYVLRRLVQMVPTFLGITVLTFAIAHLAPGDPLQLDPESARSLSVRAVRPDEPLPVQYLRWLGRVATFDFGRSLHDQRPVIEKLAEALPRTMSIAFLALLVAYGLAIPLGVYQAARPRSLVSRALGGLLFVAYSVPSFWVAVMLLLFFTGGRGLAWFPFEGLHSKDAGELGWGAWLLDTAWHLVLPVACLAYATLAVVSRQVRASMLEALTQDYVRAARARGIGRRSILFRHALRNSLLPVITMLSFSLPYLIGGSIVVERVFGIPGMGSLAFDAIGTRDYPVVMAVATLSALVTMFAVLGADLLYAVADPRIRLGGAR
ncbi:MAG: ABC transporter permease [Myxococcaceae bacterium]|nr:ABC transporter permease [Myxococcaceae bacterium]